MKPIVEPGEDGLSLDELEETLQPVLESLKPKVTGLVSETTAAAVSSGFEGAAIAGTQALIHLKLEGFVRDVVVLMVQQSRSKELGKLSIEASKRGRTLIQRIYLALLRSRYIEEAASTSVALWDAGIEQGLDPDELANMMAPPLIEAVTEGHAEEVALVQKSLLERGKGIIAQWLLVTLVSVYNRVDIAAIGTWTAVKQVSGGTETAANVAALAMVERHCDSVACVADKMYEYAKKENEEALAIEVVALAAASAARKHHPEAAVEVSERLMELGDGDLVAAAMDRMLEMDKNQEVGQITLSAVKQRKMKVMQLLVHELARKGKWKSVASAGAAVGGQIWESLTSLMHSSLKQNRN